MKKFKLLISMLLILCIMPISGVYSQETTEEIEIEFDIAWRSNVYRNRYRRHKRKIWCR